MVNVKNLLVVILVGIHLVLTGKHKYDQKFLKRGGAGAAGDAEGAGGEGEQENEEQKGAQGAAGGGAAGGPFMIKLSPSDRT